MDITKKQHQIRNLIHHELKTPLVPILGYCEMLLNPKFGQLSADQKEASQEIQKSSVNENNLINDFLNAQKLEIGEMKYYFEDISVDDFITQEMENLEPLMVQKKIEFTKSIQPELTIKADRAKLAEIFTNLVENAVAFVPESGGTIQITGKSEGGFVQFSVVDNGPGIPKDGIDSLFKKFYQIDTSHTRKHRGSGLGLTICKGYMEGMNGKIWAESEEGKGTTLFFMVPKVN